ncbi:MAG: 50S ribosomal protein L6 [Saprospirales bacterium]|nr:50S ribosomal protein L6 [Saprospirales bacterium]|tara:strand:+ start:5040 stop:5591 length:552 start_codon:yes stop_codon:yes gene_type:complete
MSRIGNAPINLPEGVEVKVDGAAVSVKGKKGELFQEIDRDLSIEIEDNVLTVKRPTDQKRHKAVHGLYRSLISNMVVGVSEGYKIELELVGVGFRASNSGQVLEMALGFSHPVVFLIPSEVKVTTEMKKGSPPLVILESNDKQLIGQVAARIRSIRKPEPYKGKGIRFKGEVLRRKEGKTAAK